MSARPIQLQLAFAAAVSLAATPSFAQGTGPLVLEQGVSVTETRIDVGLPGASTTVIDADEIARSPARSLPEMLATRAGVQARDLYGGTGGAQGTVDVRGFGATASSNTLILIDGRRVNPFDQGAVDFARIPLADVERIEVTRGSAAAVLYGDGAVGGVVNVVTKSATRQAGGESLVGGIGSLGTRQGDGSVRQSVGPLDLSAFGTFLKSDGFRENNKLVERNLLGEARHRGEAGDVFANVHLSSQGLGLPGSRHVTLTSSELISDPEGAQTPFNRSQQNDDALTLGGTHRFGGEIEGLLDGGVWRRHQDAQYVDSGSFVDTDLTTWSLTPRMKRRGSLLGLAGNLLAGADLYYYDYDSNRAGAFDAAPIHRYSAKQTNAAAYAQQTLALDDATDMTAGLRLQRSWVAAHDVFDPNAPCAFAPCGAQLAPLSKTETDWAADIGLDRRITSDVSLFGRLGRAFRFPNIDDRIGSVSQFGAVTPTFELSTQTSWDAELGGRYEVGRFSVQVSAYLMKLHNEIAFDAVNFVNVNLDPTRRRGVEMQAAAGLLSNLRARAAFAVTDARFESGPNRGKVVPVVAPYTASGTLEWDVTREIAVTGVVTYVSEKRLDNDASNFQPQIPDYALVDLRVNGKLFEHVTWSAQADNLFDKSYFNYGVASTATRGTYNAYPLPGRTFLVRLGAQF